MPLRGFFAELQYKTRATAREHEQRVVVQKHKAAVCQAQQAQQVAERAHARLANAVEAERRHLETQARELGVFGAWASPDKAELKRLEKEFCEAHIAAMEAQVKEQNCWIAVVYEEIDSLLASILGIDDFVDLEMLRTAVQHPPFGRPDLEVPIPTPAPIPDPLRPTLVVPDPPPGVTSLFGKKQHAAVVGKATVAHEQAVAEWQAKWKQTQAHRQAALDKHALAESERLAALEAERGRYASDCATREAEVDRRNKQLEELIANLGYGVVAAVHEYVSIVLSNSIYPEHFLVTHEFEFVQSSAELRLRVLIPGPEKIPKIKAFKYTKSMDEITATSLPQKVCRERYAGAVHQVALRSIHEVFESDRRGLIKTISLEVGTETVDPATGRQTYLPFVVVGAERESFLRLNLSGVIPASTLGHLGAALSRNPYGLVAVQTSGVRRSRERA